MKKIVFIADFYVDEIRGGAEICDEILIDLLRKDEFHVVKFKNKDLNEKHINLYRLCGYHFIISNFTLMNDAVSNELVKHPGCYSIMEHDHKYVKTRNPAVYKEYQVPFKDLVNRKIFINAKCIFAQSQIQAETIRKNLKINNVINLGMSLWTDSQLEIITSCADNPKQPDAAIVNSKNPTKNTQETIRFCEEFSIPYTLIGSPDYAEFIDQLSRHETYVFIPRVLESFNRVLLEARMLNCKIKTTNLNGCTSEEWFKQYKGKELINFVEQQREVVYNKIKDGVLNEKRIQNINSVGNNSDITVILNAYRRPYNLHMQIDAIRSQTQPPQQIWLWVNYHEDNKDFDFKSLDVDRIIHNDYNWKFYGRFAAALLADTEYVALYDDDTIPGTKWHENCLTTMKSNEGILGSAGVILNGTRYMQHERCGWPTQNAEITEVDLVGHAWFFKREWLKYLWQEKPTTWENGEDIQFAFMSKIHGGISTYCPPHPPDDKSMHGSVLGNELGIDNKATSTNSAVSHKQFFSERDECVQAGLRKGWETVREIKL